MSFAARMRTSRMLRSRTVTESTPSPVPSVARSEGPGFHRVEHEHRLDGGLLRMPGLVFATGRGGPDLPSETTVDASLGSLAPRCRPRGPYVFVDAETTGLAGGSLAFVIGAALVRSDRVVVRQWILTKLFGEAEMLADFLSSLRALGGPNRAPCLFSFNGASFDLPLLRARVSRHRLAGEAIAEDVAHVDLVTVARRVWRDCLPDCRLQTIERRELGFRRQGDIASRDIPQVFWSSLEHPDDPEVRRSMAMVRMHNHIDVLSMVMLVPQLANRLAAPQTPAQRLRAARHFEREGAEAAAAAALEPIRHVLRSNIDREAALLLARLQRRLGHHAAAGQTWVRLCDAFPGDPDAHDGLAKHLEHHERDPEGALRVVLGSRSPCDHRLGRLRRKIRHRVVASV